MHCVTCAWVSVSFSCFVKKWLPPTFLNSSTLLQSILTKKLASAITALPKCVQPIREALLFFYGITNVSEDMANKWLHAKMQWKSCCCAGDAVQVVNRARNALSRSIKVGRLQTAYWHYIMYENKTALIQAQKSRKDVFSPLFQQESCDGVGGPVNREQKLEEASLKRS